MLPLCAVPARPDGTRFETLRTETIKRTLNPHWREIRTDTATLCNRDTTATIRIDCFDYDVGSKDDPIGYIEMSIDEIVAHAKSNTPFTLKHPTGKIRDGKPKPVGELKFSVFEVVKQATFLDYLRGGCEISVMCAVDFTASNRSPSDPNSLHYMHPSAYNEYQQAIIAVGEILQNYDQHRMFPCYGFGAKLPSGQTSHCFALNGQPANPFCHGVGGILQAYAQALTTVQLYGPTNFAEIIKLATTTVQQYTPGQKYMVLLMLTDGEITDMAKTVDAIVRASGLPLSIVIVGVGGADFKLMEQLDGDERALSAGGMVAQRDIVQFVEFRSFRGNSQALAKEVLAEIPTQLLSYMKSKGVQPQPAAQHDPNASWNVANAGAGGVANAPTAGMPYPPT